MNFNDGDGNGDGDGDGDDDDDDGDDDGDGDGLGDLLILRIKSEYCSRSGGWWSASNQKKLMTFGEMSSKWEWLF